MTGSVGFTVCGKYRSSGRADQVPGVVSSIRSYATDVSMVYITMGIGTPFTLFAGSSAC